MRHRNKVNHLGRKTAHRKALLSNLASALILNKRIVTTLTKAKVLRGYVEPIINRSKVDSTHNRRLVFSLLQDKEMIKELFDVISQKIADRPGGYTRIIKLGFRPGDAAEMAMIELVDFNEVYTKEASEAKTKTRRSRSKAKSGGATDKPESKAKTETIDKAESNATSNDVETTQPVEEIAAPLDHGASNTPDVETVNEMEAVQIPNEEPNTLPVSEQLPEDASNISNSTESNTSTTEESNQDASNSSDVKGDDLKVVEGIGPAIEKLLQAKGIMTYEQLSNEPIDNLKAILEEAGSRFSIHDPSTWPEQATLLKEGRMEEFKKLTDELQGGKRVD